MRPIHASLPLLPELPKRTLLLIILRNQRQTQPQTSLQAETAALDGRSPADGGARGGRPGPGCGNILPASAADEPEDAGGGSDRGAVWVFDWRWEGVSTG